MDSPKKCPSLAPSFVLSSKQTSRVMTNAESPEPHQGWHSRGYLPYWDPPGMIQSVNFRLGDSLPQSVLQKWKQDFGFVLEQAGRFSGAPPFLGAPASRRRVDMDNLPLGTRRRDASAPGAKADSQRGREIELRRRIEEYLDAGHGECWLRRPEIARVVESTLFHFDGQRYRLLAWCIMPNHVHALIETREGFPLADVMHSWKSYMSHEANKLLQRSGAFWQREYLDRFVRNAEHYENVVAYIEENPVKAGLAKITTDWPWSSAKFRVSGSTGVSPAS
jgi:REP element-mobilizing transposase RayT